MTQDDLNNLHFLLTSSTEVLLDWFQHTCAADHDYAQRIMSMYKHELDIREQIVHVDQLVDAMTEFPEAAQFLRQFVDIR